MLALNKLAEMSSTTRDFTMDPNDCQMAKREEAAFFLTASSGDIFRHSLSTRRVQYRTRFVAKPTREPTVAL